MKNFNLTQEIKKYLANSTIDFYNDMRLDIDPSEYQDHYKDLGNQLMIIDSIEAVKDFIDKTMKKNRLKSGKIKTLVCLRKNIKRIDDDKEENSEFCFEGLMMRAHEELLVLMSIEETWK